MPDAPALSQALQLARALRPLAQQIEIGPSITLDEAATVEQIAETGVWQPQLKPASELWWDVALVFDTAPSMGLWQRLRRDLQRLLSRYGEFRDVRIWRLQHRGGRVVLTSRNQMVHQPSELLTGDRHRLVVVVSDCVAPAWHDGTLRSLIATWSAALPTVVFQVLPERLWARTALARSVTVEFQARQPGLPSDRLHPIARSIWDRERLTASLREPTVRLPVVPLEPAAIASWAQMVVGDRRAQVLGIVWDAPPVSFSPAALPSAPSAQARLDAFLLTASPLSRELAGLLASAPVITLPIARLIKQAMLPQASATHLAEVFMSGLLRVSGDQSPTDDNVERIAYELVDDQVRDRLRAGSQVAAALNVFDQVSQYIAKGLGKSVSEFWALLRTPGVGTEADEAAFLNAFAAVTAKLLQGLGGEFAAIANALTPTVAVDRLPDPQFPPLQTDEFTVTALQFQPEADPPLDLEPFEFTVARLVEPATESEWMESAWMEWVIQRQQRQAYRLMMPLPDSPPLELVAIPGGSFIMGSPPDEPDRYDREDPQQEVALEPFFMGRYPVTQAQWRAVAALPPVERELLLDPAYFPGDHRPVEQVSWHDAMEFCQRLSRQVERAFRLPSEAEWEYACRAGTTTPFHFGTTLVPEVANYSYADPMAAEVNELGSTVRGATVAVNHFGVANEFGLSDMHGNVWEWCQDPWRESYDLQLSSEADSLQRQQAQSDHRVARGGSWYSTAARCRAASRFHFRPSDRHHDLGFRVVCPGM